MNGMETSVEGVEETIAIKEKECCEDITADGEILEKSSRLQYTIEEMPNWYMCLFLGFQHYLTMFGSNLAMPLIVSKSLCLSNNYLAQARIVSTSFFVSGLVTLLQSTFGIRLPIVQGSSSAFIPPIMAILSMDKWKCASNTTVQRNMTSTDDSWMAAIRELQGAIMVASVVQIVIGCTGFIGFLMKFIGPMTIAPTITLVGLSLFEATATHFAGKHWGIAAFTAVLIILFSQYLKNVSLPSCGAGFDRIPIFQLFPVILAILISWFLCWILTISEVLPDDPSIPEYNIRTDINQNVLYNSPWVQFPYPGQWGMPTVSIGAVFGILSGLLASMLESLGDYFACANLSGAPPPPSHAINRGIAMEGFGCLLAGMWGTGCGTTSYSENIGVIGITKVGSRRVIQTGAVIIMVFGLLSKFGALFVTIPNPLAGGVFIVMFSMVTSVGLSNLRFVDLSSTRNLFVLGFSIFTGMTLPYWMKRNPGVINSGSVEFDQIAKVLLTNSMFVGGVLGFILDNTIPGTKEERGIVAWRPGQDVDTSDQYSCYDLPFGLNKILRKVRYLRYIPCSPTYRSS